jgi:RNA polymerase sigma-70 factor (ECF subfamily)
MAGNMAGLVELLARDAVLISDGGPEGRSVGGFRNLPRPLHGAQHVAAFVVAATKRGAAELDVREHGLNGQPAVVFWRGNDAFAALLLAVADGRIQHVYFHADLARLGHIGPRS